MLQIRVSRLLAGSTMASLALTGCASSAKAEQPLATFVAMQERPGEGYVIGLPGELTAFVWGNRELGAGVQVRPGERITGPITDMPAVGKTPSMLAEDIKLQISQYGRAPAVSAIATSSPALGADGSVQSSIFRARGCHGDPEHEHGAL
jgi:polysaccharide export outer membrane protein